jgi:hypothetical protein
MQMVIKLLIAVALVAHRAIPAGFVPVYYSNGAVGVVICSGHGVQFNTIVADNPANPSHNSSEDDGICPFAASIPVTFPIAFLERPVPLQLVADRVSSLTREHFVSRQEKTAPARAPPRRQVLRMDGTHNLSSIDDTLDRSACRKNFDLIIRNINADMDYFCSKKYIIEIF